MSWVCTEKPVPEWVSAKKPDRVSAEKPNPVSEEKPGFRTIPTYKLVNIIPVSYTHLTLPTKA